MMMELGPRIGPDTAQSQDAMRSPLSHGYVVYLVMWRLAAVLGGFRPLASAAAK
jgi:hypothetical protein